MPIYEYGCEACGHRLEVQQKIADRPLKTCPKCNKKRLTKLISSTAFVLKGGGWYRDGYGSGKTDTKTKPDTKTDTKTDSSSTTKSDTKSSSESKTSDSSTTTSKPSDGGGKGGGGKSAKAA